MIPYNICKLSLWDLSRVILQFFVKLKRGRKLIWSWRLWKLPNRRFVSIEKICYNGKKKTTKIPNLLIGNLFMYRKYLILEQNSTRRERGWWCWQVRTSNCYWVGVMFCVKIASSDSENRTSSILMTALDSAIPETSLASVSVKTKNFKISLQKTMK